MRIIQSIPSKKAEPFKLWLAQVGRERIEETLDPELIADRLVSTYERAGYTREWINQRLQSISARTNNAAEQAIRFARVKEKVSGCFRTEKGAEHFARVLSFISTAVRHGISSFDACLSLHNGTALALVEGWDD